MSQENKNKITPLSEEAMVLVTGGNKIFDEASGEAVYYPSAVKHTGGTGGGMENSVLWLQLAINDGFNASHLRDCVSCSFKAFYVKTGPEYGALNKGELAGKCYRCGYQGVKG